MCLEIKKMETDEEIRGKAFVHYSSWQEAYPGLVSDDYLSRMTLIKCEETAFRWRDNIIIAKDNDRVIGFAGYGSRDTDYPETGEIFALYVLSEYYGTGAAQQLMDAALRELQEYDMVCLWVLKDNRRAIRFYEKCGFRPDGTEMYLDFLDAKEMRMIRRRPDDYH